MKSEVKSNLFIEMNFQTTKKYIFIAIVGVLVTLTVLSISKNRSIAKTGKFVIATIQKVSTNKSGSTVIATFFFREKLYSVNFMPGYDFNKKTGRKFFVRVLTNNPNSFEFYDLDAPACISKFEHHEWETIPTCNDDK